MKSPLLILLDQLADLLRRISGLLPTVIPPDPAPKPPTPQPAPTRPGLLLFFKAESFLGRDASPLDLANDEYACAETVCDIVHATFGDFPADGPTILSTIVLRQKLDAHPKFIRVLLKDHLPGDIIIAETGTGNGKLANGHTGIFGEEDLIMSNVSATGLFKGNYTLATFMARYVAIGGFSVYVFRRTKA